MISVLLRRAGQEGWGGLEFLAGIPGSVGGAVRMNAGTHLGETRESLGKSDRAAVWESSVEEKSTNRIRCASNTAKIFFFRKTRSSWSTEWRIDRQDPALVKKIIDETLARRKQTQPSTFRAAEAFLRIPRSPAFRPGRCWTSSGFAGTGSVRRRSPRSTATSSSITAARGARCAGPD